MQTKKFIEPEWTLNNKRLFAGSEVERSRAEKLVDDIDVVIQQTNKLTEKTQKDVDRKLEQRVNEMKHWEDEINGQLHSIKIEIDSLDATSKRIFNAMDSLKEPMHITDACIEVREHRRGIELVHDEVSKELLKEKEVYKGVQSLYGRTQEQVQEQLRLARKLKYQLEKDLKDRETSLEIDKHNIELKNHKFNIEIGDQPNLLNKRPTSVDQWEALSNNRINQSNQVIKNCLDLRSLTNGILKQTWEDMTAQKKLTDEALARRLWTVRDAKDKLEEHLAKVRVQISETEISITKLQKAIEEKVPADVLSKKRLENRSKRPNVEFCNDAVQYKLMEESGLINQSVEKLEQALQKATFCLKGLRQKEIDLEDEVKIKVHTLYIDEHEVECMRKSLILREF